ncbi:MAG TPA: hypothetical protein PKL59_01020 [Nitrospira sp.]|nr:hypothetical protein [Nitrospira sp.]
MLLLLLPAHFVFKALDGYSPLPYPSHQSIYFAFEPVQARLQSNGLLFQRSHLLLLVPVQFLDRDFYPLRLLAQG